MRGVTLVLLCFLCCVDKGNAFWGLFGGKKKKSVEDERLEKMEQRSFEFKPKGNFKTKIISPSNLTRGGSGKVNWDKKWDKRDSNYFNWKQVNDHRKELVGMNKGAVGFDKQWSDGRNVYGDFDRRVRDEKRINRWNERKSALGGERRAEGYDREFAMKEYRGKELAKIKRDLDEVGSVLNTTKDLPDRPLTVAEVRDLINRGRVRESTRDEADLDARRTRRALPAR